MEKKLVNVLSGILLTAGLTFGVATGAHSVKMMERYNGPFSSARDEILSSEEYINWFNAKYNINAADFAQISTKDAKKLKNDFKNSYSIVEFLSTGNYEYEEQYMKYLIKYKQDKASNFGTGMASVASVIVALSILMESGDEKQKKIKNQLNSNNLTNEKLHEMKYKITKMKSAPNATDEQIQFCDKLLDEINNLKNNKEITNFEISNSKTTDRTIYFHQHDTHKTKPYEQDYTIKF